MSSQKDPAGLNSIGSRLRFLLRDSVIYGGAAAIGKSFWLISFPLLARHFTVDEYGIVDYFFTMTTFLVAFFVFGQDSAVARFFYHYEGHEERKQLISQSLTFQLGGVALLLPFFWLFADRIMEHLIEVDEGALLFKYVLLQVPFFILINFAQNLLKWTFARSRFLIISLGYAACQASLLILGVLVLNVDMVGVLIINLAAAVGFAALGVFFVREWLVRPKSFDFLREMLPFAIPYGLVCVLAAFSPTLQRTLTESQLGTESLGLYAAAAQIAMLVTLLAGAFQTAWGPFSLSLYKRSDSGETYNWVLKLFTLAVCIGTMMLTVLAQPIMVTLAGDRYVGGLIVVFPLAMGLAVQSVSWITEIGIDISRRSYLIILPHLLAIFVTAAVIFLSAPWIGLLGVGLGALSGFVAKAIVASWLAQRVYPLPWQYGSVLILMTVTFGSGVFSLWIAEVSGNRIGNLARVLSIVVLMALGWWTLFTRAERLHLQSLLFRRRRGSG